jgi:hypothetical protein
MLVSAIYIVKAYSGLIDLISLAEEMKVGGIIYG